MNYSISDGILSVRISDIGAELQSIQKNGQEYLWQGDETFWSDRSPVLFPYVGRFTNGCYQLHGQQYQMDIHGFAKSSRFIVVEKAESFVTFQLTENAETLAHYPYAFDLKVTYRIEQSVIHVGYSVKNRSKECMYFGIGGHPGFRVPLEEGLEFQDYVLEFEESCQPERIGHSETCYLNGKNEIFALESGTRIHLKHELFDNDAIVLKNIPGKITLKSDKGACYIAIQYEQLPYLGIWHAPHTQAPYVCIEPWTSLPSREGIVEEFAAKTDLIRLAPSSNYQVGWSINVG